MGPALLLAHGAPGDVFHDRAFERLAKHAPKVAYLGAANRDHAGTYLHLADGLRRRYGARVEQARTMTDDGAQARAALAEADLIYLGGGDVQLLATRLRVLGLDSVLRTCHAAGAMLFGVSAGAIGLAPWWIAFPEAQADAEAKRFPCAGALPFALDCHDEADDWQELRALLARWGTDEPSAVVAAYGIPSGGALEVDARGQVMPFGLAPKRLKLDHGRVLDLE
jgi:hypothetical protein